ncbi:recombination regulator RecX [Collinsella sp. AGMB00827]|uniref:Regulatory protein RecX n=1 Tax=Collinsella ureilytica TaxID=2869515 RepID=A0ABS7MKU7_9ACTN|nr:regulatory protein RecX [Collinsella urealyticum]MBY4797989.1 recombination regulator RecX [Collinsella urealyticum]
MNPEVEAIEVELSKRAPRRYSSPTHAQANLILKLSDGSLQSLHVPVRVAKALNISELCLPQELSFVRAELAQLMHRTCFVALTEVLSRRDYASTELERKLANFGFDAETIQAALIRAQARGFQNDARFMEAYVQERIRRGWGRRKIEAALSQIGLDPHDLPEYPEAFFTSDGELDRARLILERRSIPENRAFEKLARHLVGRGFSHDIAAAAARARLEMSSV